MRRTQLGKTFRVISDTMIKILTKEFKGYDLSSTQGMALICLNEEETKELPIKIIEKALSTSQPNTLGIINRLEQKELVATHLTQQRTKIVKITDKGLSNIQTVELYMEEVDNQVLHGFTEDEKELFLEFLKRAESNLSNFNIKPKKRKGELIMNEDLSKIDDLAVSKAVFSNAIPAMAAMIMVLIYNIADLFFIGQTGNDLQVAAISLATPLFLIFMSLGNVFGIGGASLLSRKLGNGDKEAVKNISSFCFWSCAILGILLSLGVYLGVTSVVKILGASGETAVMVEDYIRLLSLSGVFILFSSCYSNLVRAEGNPKQATIGMIIGNITNIVLDPIFILVFDLGVVGAAYATAIGNTLGGLYYIYYLLKNDTILSIKTSDFTMSNGILTNVLAIGIPASLSTILMGASQMFINIQMAEYGDLAVAGIGVAMKTTMITTMVCIGLGMGVQPLLGYAIGSKNEQRYKEIFKFSMIFAFCLSAVLTLICYLFLNQIVSAFVSDIESFDYAYKFSQILISTSVIVGMLYVLSNALQAAGAAKSAFIINISRQGIFYIPLLSIMGGFLGINGLVFAQPVSDVLTLILSAIIYLKISKTFFSNDLDESMTENIDKI